MRLLIAEGVERRSNDSTPRTARWGSSGTASTAAPAGRRLTQPDVTNSLRASGGRHVRLRTRWEQPRCSATAGHTYWENYVRRWITTAAQLSRPLVHLAAAATLIAVVTGSALAVTSPAWTIVATPNPPPRITRFGSDDLGGTLGGVSCVSANSCWAVGASGERRGVGATLGEFWDGTSWRLESTPNPTAKTEKFAELFDVSCASKNACLAVGGYNNVRGVSFPLAEIWDGHAWRIAPTPASGTRTELNGVSCSSRRSCLVVGHSDNGFFATKGLAESWSGQRWALTDFQPSTLPYAVSCFSSTRCMAVGETVFTRSGSFSLSAETWNGRTWSTIALSQPAHAYQGQLRGVSCASSRVCVAVGGYSLRRLLGVVDQHPLVGVWRGARWDLQALPNPVGARYAELSSVSCSSATACTATGEYSTSPSGKASLWAASWDGRTWHAQLLPRPSNASASLGGPGNPQVPGPSGGVFCTAPRACMAVGGSIRGGGNQATLAERYQKSR